MNREASVRAFAWMLATAAALGGCSSPATPAPSHVELQSAIPGFERVAGVFAISNTTPGGGPVEIAALEVHLEDSPAGDVTWSRMAVPCATQPAVPVAFDDRLVVSYACEAPAGEIPAGARLRAVVEARITGSDEVFRMESELAR